MEVKSTVDYRATPSKKMALKSTLHLWWNILVEHQIGNIPYPSLYKQPANWDSLEFPLIIILSIITGDILRIPLAAKFLRIQYRVPGEESLYVNGVDDAYFVAFWIVAFTFLRASIMEYVLKPIAKIGAIRSRGAQQRFLEQSWLFLYYTVSWSIGFYIIYSGPYWTNTAHFWIQYPHKAIPHLSKWYYLVQTGFWLQQFFVLHAEKKRSDYPQMLIHHIATSLLVSGSYITYFTRIGTSVLCIMDSADILLALAKCLRYLKFQKLCDCVFGSFVLVWAYTRHYLGFKIMWSMWIEADMYLQVDCRPYQGIFLCRELQYLFVGLFAVLQVLMIFWFIQILKIIWRVLSGSNAEDTRSDSESENVKSKET
ncbi:Sphingosine N-acyltransferase lag1 [Basidiobolus ranarum]|uniref:Sphingosine N-acyltransferase lag1 n=1 Tax=Basidiobolus ranarum TaxID=34480 RepID=A0ABR2VPT8_9FUNG